MTSSEITTPAAGPITAWERAAAQAAKDAGASAPAASTNRFWRRFSRQRLPLVALGFLGLIAVIAVLAPWLAPADPDKIDLGNALQRPPGGKGLGTDQLGRDNLSRLIVASRVSVQAAVQSVGIGILLGVPAGLVAGYFGGRLDSLLTRITDAVMAFPPLILAIAVIAALGPNLTNAMLAIGIIFAPRFMRLVRAEVLAIREETYIEAARSVGTGSLAILWRHVIPNALPPLIVQASLSAGFAMLAEAGLSFLGLGVQPPQASWGSMLADAAAVINREWSLMVAPGVMIVLITLAFNILGDGIRDSIGRETRGAPLRRAEKKTDQAARNEAAVQATSSESSR